ncbi:hypothetical protein ACET3Z_022868 [Daucus carota]
MSRYNDLSDQMASLDVEEEENEAFIIEGEGEEEIHKYELCLVGRFLSERSVNVRAMKTKMADLWRPAMGPAKSKWLREDGDTEWEERQKRVNASVNSGDGSFGKLNIPLIQGRDFRNQTKLNVTKSSPEIASNKNTSIKGGASISNFENGPEEDELIGLELIERKRLRGPNEVMDTEGGLPTDLASRPKGCIPDVALSEMDCSTSSVTVLATLAQQASQQP